MSFQGDINRAANKLGDSMEKTAKAVIISLFEDVIKDTPVDEGRLAGNWVVTLNTPSTVVLRLTDKGKAKTISKAQRKVRKPGVYYLTNNLPYAMVAEYGQWGTGPGRTVKTTMDGFSVQAPYGMVRKNVRRVQQILREVAK